MESVSARLGHASTAITMQAYVHAFDSAARSDERRDRLDALYGDGRPMVGADGSPGQQTADAPGGDVVDLRREAVGGSRQQ